MIAATDEIMPRPATVAAQLLQQWQRNICHSRIIHVGTGVAATVSNSLAAQCQERGIEGKAEQIADIPKCSDPWYGLHAPVKAQLMWPQQQLQVPRWQVHKCQSACPPTGLMSRWIVRSREVDSGTWHQTEATVESTEQGNAQNSERAKAML